MKTMANDHWRLARECFFYAAGFALLLSKVSSATERGPSQPAASQPSAVAAALVSVPSALAPDEAMEWSTADESRSILLREGTSIRVGPNSRVRRLPMITVSLGVRGAAPQLFCLELTSGRVDVEIDARTHPFYAVLLHAPRKVGAILKTGRATLTVTPTATTVAARAGADMNVAVSERWRPLRVGRSFTVTNADSAGTQRPLLTAPTLHVEPSVVLALGADAPRQRLSWREISNSTGYQLRIRQVLGMTTEVVREVRMERASEVLAPLAPGRYLAEVSSIDTVGIESAPSAAVQLRVVEARLPEGAVATSEAIHLPANARITLVNSEDLEMTYGTSNALFVSAPVTIGLHDGNAVRIRLREKGSTTEAQLQLEPLDVRPQIAMEPSRAVWPGTPVSIRVSLRRSNGMPLADANSVSASVTINAQPVLVQWKRSAGTLRTAIDKPPFPGPWVVRVFVQDSRGHVLAHDFLEVAQQPRGEIVLADP